jgi:hypothetical protein
MSIASFAPVQSDGSGTVFTSVRERTRTIGQRIDALLERSQVWFLSLSCAAILQIALIATHRPWFDEWQGLLIARQTPTLASMFEQLHYEGHPQLWYLVLRAIGGLVPVDWIFPATNLGLAAVAWWAIVLRSPFRRLDRLLLLLNEIVLIGTLTISRSPSLGVALLFLAAALWRSRSVWLVIALLPLCDFFFGAIACALIVIRIRHRQDGRFPYAGILLFAACGLIAALGVIPAGDAVATPARGWVAGSIVFTRDLGTLFFPLEIIGYDRPAPLVIGLLLAPVFLFTCVSSLREDGLSRALLFAFFGVLLAFECWVYPIYVRHMALAAILLIVLVWIGALTNRQPGAAFRVWLCAAALCGVGTAIANLLIPFDSAAQAASIIRGNNLQKKLWFSFPTFRTIALAGETGVAFGDLEQGCAVQFVRWNVFSGIRTKSGFFAAVHAAQQRYGSFYLVTDVPLPADIGRPLATVPAGYSEVQYRLWKVGNGPAPDSNLQLCVSGVPRWPGTTPSK